VRASSAGARFGDRLEGILVIPSTSHRLRAADWLGWLDSPIREKPDVGVLFRRSLESHNKKKLCWL
jgi:hypothetical protein